MIAVIGERGWIPVAGRLLERAGLAHDEAVPTGRLALIRWALGAGRRYAAIHHVMGCSQWRTSLAMMLTGRPVVWHWIGSDVLGYRQSLGSWAGWVNRRAARMRRCVHLADSPELAGELRELGIDSEVVRLLPDAVEAEIEPLPEQFSVLSYWNDKRLKFYGGEIILRLAEALPDVPFRIVGAKGEGVEASANVAFLGYVDDLSEIYRQSTVFLRMPEHDSLSAMVLEALARGRHVIYNKPFPGCVTATNYEEALTALRRLREQGELNREGSERVKREFSCDREAEKLGEVYKCLAAGL